MFRFKTSLIFIAIAFLLSNHAHSQSTSDTLKNQFQFSKYSLQFEIYDLYKFRNFDGLTFSGKYHFNNNSSIRLGLSLNSKSDESNDVLRTITGDSVKYIRNSDSDVSSINLSVLYTYYFNPQGRVKAFIGVGPSFTFGRDNSFYQFDDKRNSINSTDSKNNYWGFGLSTTYGVEWFFLKNDMSLFLAYGMDIFYSKSEITIISTNEAEELNKDKFDTSENSIELTYKRIRLGLSIYFN